MEEFYSTKLRNDFEYQIYKKINYFIKNNLSNTYSSKNRAWKVGYDTLGILLTGFCKWINKNVKENNINQIFFLSRDGYIVKKAYEILYGKKNTRYLYVSRKSLLLPSIHGIKKAEEILDFAVLPPIFDIEDLLNYFNINANDKQDIISKCEIKFEEKFYRKNLKQNKKILKLINIIFNEIKLKSDQQFSNFIEYLNQNSFEGKVAIVDIGWHNSIQNSLVTIINNSKINTKIHGYYIGIYDNSIKISGENKANGFLYEYGKKINKQYQTFAFVSLFESLFLSHEGTTLSYEKSKKNIKPILSKYEYKNSKEMFDVIKNVQDGALTFVGDFKVNENMNKVVLTSNIASANIIQFGLYPMNKDIELFGKLNFENFSKNNLINYNKNTLYYLLHLKKLKEDFYKSGWRIVFLKNLMSFPFPHFLFFKILCRIFL